MINKTNFYASLGAVILWLGIILMLVGRDREPVYSGPANLKPNCKTAEIVWEPMKEGNYQFRIICKERNNVDD